MSQMYTTCSLLSLTHFKWLSGVAFHHSLRHYFTINFYKINLQTYMNLFLELRVILTEFLYLRQPSKYIQPSQPRQPSEPMHPRQPSQPNNPDSTYSLHNPGNVDNPRNPDSAHNS